MDYSERIIMICQGNPGAIQVLLQVEQHIQHSLQHRIQDSVHDLLSLQSMYLEQIDHILTLLEVHHIYASDIWVIYKQCNKNIATFLVYPFETYKKIKM